MSKFNDDESDADFSRMNTLLPNQVIRANMMIKHADSFGSNGSRRFNRVNSTDKRENRHLSYFDEDEKSSIVDLDRNRTGEMNEYKMNLSKASKSEFENYDASLITASKRTSFIMSRADSMEKIQSRKEHKKSGSITKDLKIKPINTVVYGKAALEMKKEKARKRKELKEQKEEIKRLEEVKRLEDIEKQRQREANQVESRRLVRKIKQRMREQLKQATEALNNLERQDSEQYHLINIQGSDTSEEDRNNQKEEANLRHLRKELLRRDSFDTTVIQRLNSINSESSKNKSSRDFGKTTIEKRTPSLPSAENKKEIKNLAYQVTEDAIQKEKFFKIVKGVISGRLIESILDSKFGKAILSKSKQKVKKEEVTNKLAQIKFIQKCKEENVLALPMLNRLKDKKLVLNNYRMNEGISKALSAAIKELGEYIEVIGLESNDINDIALESILTGVFENKYIHNLTIEKNLIEEKSAHILNKLIQEYTDYSDGESKRVKCHLKSIKIRN